MKLALSLLATLLAFAGAAQAQNGSKPDDCAAKNGAMPSTWEGTAFAIDGDTLAGVGLKPHIRIWGIQAPELRDKQTGQETIPGMRSRAELVDMLAAGKQNVSCRPTKWDRYCRMVAQCRLDGTRLDIGAVMIGRGWAYGYYLEEALPWDLDAGARYIEAETNARKARAGLWLEWMGSGR